MPKHVLYTLSATARIPSSPGRRRRVSSAIQVAGHVASPDTQNAHTRAIPLTAVRLASGSGCVIAVLRWSRLSRAGPRAPRDAHPRSCVRTRGVQTWRTPGVSAGRVTQEASRSECRSHGTGSRRGRESRTVDTCASRVPGVFGVPSTSLRGIEQAHPAERRRLH
jgi:hypothetical protein